MTVRLEAFVDEDAGKCGAILRRQGPDGLTTRTVFRMGDDAPVYLVDHSVSYNNRIQDWTSFAYESPTSETSHRGSRDDDGAALVDGEAAPGLGEAIPGYAEILLVDEAMNDARTSVEYRFFDESEPDEGVKPAVLRREGTEDTELLDGTSITAERVRQVVQGTPANTHWYAAGDVVKSDWCGAQSFHVDDLDVLLEGLDDEVRGHITDFVGNQAASSK